MNDQLRYLMEEICAGVEIYYTGRAGTQYVKTAFILCDDYTELTSKLYLVTFVKGWSDTYAPPKTGFKGYHKILNEVYDAIKGKRSPTDLKSIRDIHERMKACHERRNNFFHSTGLLDLNITPTRCVEAFCDLFDYGEILFQAEWRKWLELIRNLDTLEVMLRLEKKAISDPSITSKWSNILAAWPRNHTDYKVRHDSKGIHLAIHPDDLHLRLCVMNGGKGLRDKLRSLL